MEGGGTPHTPALLTRTQEFIKKCKFCSSSHPQGKRPADGKVCHVGNKKNHFKVCYPCVGKKVHEIEKDDSDEPSDQGDYDFFFETVDIQNSAHINQIKNENPTWSITLPSNEIPVWCKIETKAQCNIILLTTLEKCYPELDLCPKNIKLSTYNSKIPVLGKCSFTLKHKKDHFDVSFIVVNSKSVPILGLATSENLNLIKHISVVNVSDEQFLFEFSDCFGEIGTLKNTHHFEIKDNVKLLSYKLQDHAYE